MEHRNQVRVVLRDEISHHEFARDYNGTCGDHLTWSFDGSVLTIPAIIINDIPLPNPFAVI